MRLKSLDDCCIRQLKLTAIVKGRVPIIICINHYSVQRRTLSRRRTGALYTTNIFKSHALSSVFILLLKYRMMPFFTQKAKIRTSRKGSKFLSKIPEVKIKTNNFIYPAISLNDLCVREKPFWKPEPEPYQLQLLK
jgi:hypothetical protein